MILKDQYTELLGLCPTDYESAVERVAAAGRVCYRSEAKTDAVTFIEKRLAPNPPHSSILEHSSLAIRKHFIKSDDAAVEILYELGRVKSKWLYSSLSDDGTLTRWGNLRAYMGALNVKHPASVYAWVEENGYEIVPQQELPRNLKRVTAKLVTDRAVLAEITRHRDDVGFSVESQRYVDLVSSVCYIKPSWYDTCPPYGRELFSQMCADNETDYKTLRSMGLIPQHARTALNNQVQTVIVMTAYLPEWDWIFKLRRASGAYPQMIKLMDGLYEQFKESGFINDANDTHHALS